MKRTLLLIPIVLAGCGKSDSSSGRLSALEKEITELRLRVASHNEKQADNDRQQSNTIEELKESILTKADHDDIEKKVDREMPAIVDPANKSYSVARNEYGAFPVIIEDAQPYLDGHKVRFRIGNLSGATLTGVSLRITYGARYPDEISLSLTGEARTAARRQYYAKLREILKARRTIALDVNQDLAASNWNVIETVVSPSKSEDLGRIEVLIQSTGMKMPVKK
jgi:hypothetical protein